MWWWLPGCSGIGGGGSAPVVVAPVEVPRAEVAAGDGAVPSLEAVRAAVAETRDPTLSSWMELPAFVMPVDADHPQLGQVPGFALFWVSPALDHPTSFVVAQRARDGALVVPDRNARGIAAVVAEAPAWYRTDHGVEVLTALAARGGRVVWDPARLRSADDAPLAPTEAPRWSEAGLVWFVVDEGDLFRVTLDLSPSPSLQRAVVARAVRGVEPP